MKHSRRSRQLEFYVTLCFCPQRWDRWLRRTLAVYVPFISSLFLFVSIASADVLCFRTFSRRAGNKNVVQVFQGERCPSGFSRVTADLVASSSPGPTGPTGPSGAQGPEGIAGLIGPTGPSGSTGSIGATGPMGVAGLQGPTGSQGPTGPQGPTGVSGAALFSFSGSTAETLINGGFFNFVSISGEATDIGSSIFAVGDRGIPVLSSCSSIQYLFQLSAAPGDGPTWDISLLIGDDYTSAVAEPLCTITSTDVTCAGTKTVAIGAGQTLALLFAPTAAPTDTKAKWSVRCLAN